MPPRGRREIEPLFPDDSLNDLALAYYLCLPRETLDHLIDILQQGGVEPSTPLQDAIAMRGEKIPNFRKPRRKWRHE